MKHPHLLLLPLLAIPAASAPASSEDWSCRYDCPPRRAFQDTPAGRVNLAPPPGADFEHMRLDLLINDMNTPEIEAVSRLTMTASFGPIAELGLDAHLLDIESVEAAGYQTTFDHDGHALCVRFDPPVPQGQSVTLVTTYRIIDPPYGMIWTPASDAFPGRAAQLHTQGEPETNSYWFPCHDFPNDRMTTELVVTSPQGFQVLSNGRLVGKDRRVVKSRTVAGEHDLQWYDIWHWAQDEQAGGGHVPYLVTLVVGKFDVVDVGTEALPMPVYVPKGRGKDVETTYGDTPEMVALFERLFDEPYPWSKYAQAVLWNFGAGGMENTSATSMFDSAIYSEAEAIDQDYDGLIAHELGHQWFGDLITCDTWEHIWLNEGFATYASTLWFEHRDGPTGYLAEVQSDMDAVIRSDRGTAPGTPAMVSPVYEHPWEVFGRGANPYPKGASILHMLRRRLGDKAFFTAVADYLDEHKHTTAETQDLVASFEQSTGASLGSFINQWAYRPGVPRVKIETAWDEAAGQLRIRAEQTQPIDADNPPFVFDLPVWLHAPGGPKVFVHTETLRMEGPTAELTIPLTVRPDMVVFNPNLDVLAELDIRQATVLWLEQLASAPTLPGKVQAARALANPEGAAAGRLLYATALDKSAHRMLRVEAVKALEAQGDLSRVFFLVPQRGPAVEEPAVRVQVLEALGRMGLDHPQGSTGKSRRQIMTTLIHHAINDPSANCRAAAVRALGTMKAVDAEAIITQAAGIDAPRDSIRRAAVESLARLNTPAALSTVLAICEPGTHDRTRPAAIRSAVELMHHDPDAVRAMLVRTLNDTNRRAWEAAADQLADLGGDWAVEALTRRVDSLRDPLDIERMNQRIAKASG